MSRYGRGRVYEGRAAKLLRTMGLYAIRVPLSKGFYLITSAKSDNGATPILRCNGDVAVWCNGGLPIPVEVKRVGGGKNGHHVLSIARRRLSKHRWSETEIGMFGGRLPVMVSYRQHWFFCVYDRNRKQLYRLSYDEFCEMIRSMSVALRERLYTYNACGLVPYDGNDSPC